MTELWTCGIQSKYCIYFNRFQTFPGRTSDLSSQGVTNKIHAVEVSSKLTIEVPYKLGQLSSKGLYKLYHRKVV